LNFRGSKTPLNGPSQKTTFGLAKSHLPSMILPGGAELRRCSIIWLLRFSYFEML
jgi:hypothetical protein